MTVTARPTLVPGLKPDREAWVTLRHIFQETELPHILLEVCEPAKTFVAVQVHRRTENNMEDNRNNISGSDLPHTSKVPMDSSAPAARDTIATAGEIANEVSYIAKARGERLQYSAEIIGHRLKKVGLVTRRLGKVGNGLMMDPTTIARVHELAAVYTGV
jgi:hypothetical protein